MGRSKNRKMVFKQFTVLDDRCAMKIGTDGVVLGVVANHANPAKILDIGTGSGIVALMLAQRFPDSNVTAIEIEPEAFSQACENIKESPFEISCFHESFQDYTLRDELKFDLIVANPPFFDGTSKSPYEARNMARHDDYLKLKEIFSGAEKLLEQGGRLVVVWPVEREDELNERLSESSLNLVEVYDILPTVNHKPVRLIVSLMPENKSGEETTRTQIILENGEGDYRKFTPEYISLMKDFFLAAD